MIGPPSLQRGLQEDGVANHAIHSIALSAELSSTCGERTIKGIPYSSELLEVTEYTLLGHVLVFFHHELCRRVEGEERTGNEMLSVIGTDIQVHRENRECRSIGNAHRVGLYLAVRALVKGGIKYTHSTI